MTRPDLNPEREEIARIIDPVAWAGTDDFATNPPKDQDDPRLFERWVLDGTAPSLSKADAILALLTVVEGELSSSGAGPDMTPSCGATDDHNHSGEED